MYYACLFQLHPRFVLSDGVQADPEWVRVGSAEQGHRKQPQGLSALTLRAGTDVVVGQIPRFLHGAKPGLVELQLHG